MRNQLTHDFYRDEFEEEGYEMPIHPRIPALCQIARNAIGSPLYITSGVRSPKRNALVGGSENSSHLKGLAVDISTNRIGESMSPRHRFVIVRALIDAGVTRIGIAKTFIHFDVDPDKIQNVIWTY